MIERGQHFGFALEAGQSFGIAGKLLGQDLDGYVAAELGVMGLIDVAHATGADVAGDFVGSEFCAGTEHYSRRTARSGCATRTFTLVKRLRTGMCSYSARIRHSITLRARAAVCFSARKANRRLSRLLVLCRRTGWRRRRGRLGRRGPAGRCG